MESKSVNDQQICTDPTFLVEVNHTLSERMFYDRMVSPILVLCRWRDEYKVSTHETKIVVFTCLLSSFYFHELMMKQFLQMLVQQLLYFAIVFSGVQ